MGGVCLLVRFLVVKKKPRSERGFLNRGLLEAVGCPQTKLALIAEMDVNAFHREVVKA